MAAIDLAAESRADRIIAHIRERRRLLACAQIDDYADRFYKALALLQEDAVRENRWAKYWVRVYSEREAYELARLALN